ncbi:hypothetical protein CI109_105906 [Kwoniella shandongensis]|uniref:FAD/NAD(P)-binding domain-containing protein n=1 Tax=Kwoniella shandongensis TaxID=1734106 RepID=A0A5M6BQ47_9TREE|nr:uncharacterized protein CI109_006664 [Kwoniella shandongensis]KAA5525024.1 hypothetical protein CI109_006664 [Kwoniella shandongensis]
MTDYYAFSRPIKGVAIIGAGPSGVPAARQLRDAGLDVTLIERQDKIGGLWNWQEETTGPLSVPTPVPSKGAFEPVLKGEEEGDAIVKDTDGKRRRAFNPPNPCYWNLTNNVPTKTLAFKDFPYPPNTPDSVPHWTLAGYIHDYWRHFNLQPLTRLNTRVENAYKRDDGLWELTLRTLEIIGEDELKETFSTETFDAIIVATGHYNAPLIPKIPGAAEWYQSWPEGILHSQGYRRPEAYTDQTVLVIGAGTSGMDIARDLATHAGKVLISSRIDRSAPTGYQNFREAQRSRTADNNVPIGEIKAFRPPQQGQVLREGEIELVDGSVITGVDAVIFCTGYQYSFPFLRQYHRDAGMQPTDLEPLVERGDQILNLYRDVFYIPDPTLAFLGVSVNTSAFSFFEYQSISIARVFAGKARLPTQLEQRAALAKVVGQKGPGKFRHFKGQEGEREYVRETVEWLNRDAEWSGAEKVEGHTKEWLRESDQIAIKIAAKYGVDAGGLQDISGNADPSEKQKQPTHVQAEKVDITVQQAPPIAVSA